MNSTRHTPHAGHHSKRSWLLALVFVALTACTSEPACPEPSTTDGRSVCDGRFCDPGFHCEIVDGEAGGSVGVCESGCTQSSECAEGLVCLRGGGGLAGVCGAPAPGCPGTTGDGGTFDGGMDDGGMDDALPSCTCDATPACEEDCICDDDCPSCACDTSSACDDTEGSACRCDTDCRPEVCDCDAGPRCTAGCSCDPHCTACACDTDRSCSEGCGCDRDCVGCACDIDEGCSADCACDPDCSCSNTCDYARDGECDDGGPGADYALCGFGTDCDDCGPRACGCGDLECGVGPCGEACGTCAGEEACNAGRCEILEPACTCDRRPGPYCDVGCECDPACPIHACGSSHLEVGDECGPGGAVCCQTGLRCSCEFFGCTATCRAREYSSCRSWSDCDEGLRCVDGYCERGEGEG